MARRKSSTEYFNNGEVFERVNYHAFKKQVVFFKHSKITKMKPQSIQKLFAFSIIMFCFSFSHAQQCKGPNHIWVCHCSRSSDFYCYTVCKCIHVNQVKSHLRDGWTLSSPSDAAKSIETSSDLFSISVINSTAINLALAKPQTVSLKIYDITGRLIKTFVDGRMQEGVHQIEWNKRDEAGNIVSAGIYTLRFDAGAYSETKRLAVIR